RIDLQDRAGDCHRELSAEELGTDVVDVCELDLGALPIGAVGPFSGRRDEALALLAGRLCDQLLGPEAESPLRLGDAHLVAPLAPGLAELEAELQPRA